MTFYLLILYWDTGGVGILGFRVGIGTIPIPDPASDVLINSSGIGGAEILVYRVVGCGDPGV